LADAICKDNHFALDAGGKLYRFTGGVYRAKGEQFVKRRVKRLLHEWEMTEKWSRRLADEVVEYIGVDAPEL